MTNLEDRRNSIVRNGQLAKKRILHLDPPKALEISPQARGGLASERHSAFATNTSLHSLMDGKQFSYSGKSARNI